MTVSLPITLAFTPGLAIAGAVAMAVPIIIHLLSRFRRKREPWGAMRFLLEAYRKHRRRLQIEQLLLLAVRCLLLLVLGFALAGPVLSGCAGRLAGGLDASGREVYLVIDDGLTSRAAAGPDVRRFDELKKTALAMLDGLGPGDRVAIHRTAEPIKAELAPPSIDTAVARRAIEAMTPRYTAPDLVASLTTVQESIQQQRTPADRVFVVLLSDLSRSALDDQVLAAGAPGALRQLGTQAKLVMSPPVVGSVNAQLSALTPRRTMVLVESGSPASVPVELQVRRFDNDAPAATMPIELAVIADDGKPIGQPLRRDVRWTSGQTTAQFNVELPLTMAGGDDPTQAVTAAIQARIVPDAGGADVLAEDDSRYAVVELRRRLTVAVVGDAAASASTGGGFSPRQWLGLALSPRGEGANGTIDVADVTADGFHARPSTATPLDAALVTRPDLLTVEGWQALRRVADDGGLVWVFAPANDSASVWGQMLATAFDVGWQVGMEPVSTTTAEDDEQPRPWLLDVNAAVPEPLSLLASDWPDLLRPVWVTKRLDLTVREGQDKVWLTLDSTIDAPLLVATDIGEGKLLLLATALDADWTNLPTKPLFVPLLHETLRSVLGGSTGLTAGGSTPLPGASRRQAAVVGTTPTFGRKWLGVQELALADGSMSLQLTAAESGVSLNEPIEAPGIWRAMPESAGRKLAANVDADAGDTRALDATQLGEWLGAIGAWTQLNPNDPAAALQIQRQATDIGWPLLWIALALLLIETFLARRFSHAEVAVAPIGAAALLRRALAPIQQRGDSSQAA